MSVQINHTPTTTARNFSPNCKQGSGNKQFCVEREEERPQKKHCCHANRIGIEKFAANRIPAEKCSDGTPANDPDKSGKPFQVDETFLLD